MTIQTPTYALEARVGVQATRTVLDTERMGREAERMGRVVGRSGDRLERPCRCLKRIEQCWNSWYEP